MTPVTVIIRSTIWPNGTPIDSVGKSYMFSDRTAAEKFADAFNELSQSRTSDNILKAVVVEDTVEPEADETPFILHSVHVNIKRNEIEYEGSEPLSATELKGYMADNTNPAILHAHHEPTDYSPAKFRDTSEKERHFFFEEDEGRTEVYLSFDSEIFFHVMARLQTRKENTGVAAE